MVGRPKGRSIKALRERVDALVSTAATRPTGILLSQYLQKVNTAKRWRGGTQVHTLDDTELENDIATFEGEGTVLPADICQALVQRRADRYAASKDWGTWVACMLPITSDGSEGDVFDPKAPTMARLPRVSAWRFQAFNHAFFEKLLLPLLFEGGSSAPPVKAISHCVLDAMEAVDIIALDQAAASFVDDMQLCMNGLITIIDLPFSSEHSEAVQTLAVMKGPRKGIVEILATALDQAQWYSDRAKRYINNMSLIVEKEGAMQKHEAFLRNFVPAVTNDMAVASNEALLAIHTDLGKVLQNAEGEAVSAMSNMVLKVTEAHVNQCLQDYKEAEVADGFWDQLANMLTTASINFSMDERIPSWLQDLQEVQRSASSKSMVGRLEDAIKIVSDKESIDTADCAAVQKNCQTCAGMRIDNGAKGYLHSLLAKLTNHILRPSEEDGVDQSVVYKTLDDCLRFVDNYGGWRKVGMQLNLARALGQSKTCLDAPYSELKDEEIRVFRKSLAEVKDNIEKTSYAGTGDVPPNILKDVEVYMKSLCDEYTAKNGQMLKQAVEDSLAAWTEATTCLVQVAYGVPGEQQAWSHGLKASATLDEVTARAAEKGIPDLDLDMLGQVILAHKTAESRHQVACDAAGLQVDRARAEESAVLRQRCALTRVEAGLLRLIKGGLGGDDIRPKIQAYIRELRQVDLKEKEALPSALFKWSFRVIVGR